MKSIAIKYFNAFESKDLSTLRELFDNDVTLRDWDVEATGVDSVIAAATKIFNSVEFISVQVINIFHDGNFVVSELIITINKTESVRVVDILEINSLYKICSIRAYKG
jgi:limonene-1,2-epoxide hydrolase